jgi:hypothetical protein
MNIDDEWLDNFFQKRTESGILRRRESITIEFKECINWTNKEFKSKIAKTSSAFSNTKGGVIFFGIKDNPHEIIGIDNWDQFDSEQLSTYFNTYYSPHIDFDLMDYVVEEKKIGLLIIHESQNKPIICIRDSSCTTDSSIFFRYNGSSSKIKSGDLHYLLSEVRQKEQERWLDVFSNISRIGINNIGVFDESNGLLISNSNNQFLLDDSLLQKIKVIDKFSEHEDGSPALRIVGDIQSSTHVVERIKSIYEENIFESFLGIKSLVSGKEYLESIFRQNSEYYPIYKFIYECIDPQDKEETIAFLESIKTRSWIKKRVIERIKTDNKLLKKHESFPLTSKRLGPQRKRMFDYIISKSDIDFQNEDDCKSFLESIFNLTTENVPKDYIFEKMVHIYEDHYPFEKDSINYIFRWVLSYLDLIIFNKFLN